MIGNGNTPEIDAVVSAAVALAIDEYRAWATKQFELNELAEGEGAAARAARQYLANGRGARVFLAREVQETGKAVQHALNELKRRPDSFKAVIAVELARGIHADAKARHQGREPAALSQRNLAASATLPVQTVTTDAVASPPSGARSQHRPLPTEGPAGMTMAERTRLVSERRRMGTAGQIRKENANG